MRLCGSPRSTELQRDPFLPGSGFCPSKFFAKEEEGQANKLTSIYACWSWARKEGKEAQGFWRRAKAGGKHLVSSVYYRRDPGRQPG